MTPSPTIRELAQTVLTPAQYAAWQLDTTGISQREIAYRLDISRSSVIDRLDAADRTLRRHGIHKTPGGVYYLEETA